MRHPLQAGDLGAALTSQGVELLEEGDAAIWNAYVRQSGQATIFHSTPWKTVFETIYGCRGYYLYRQEQDGIKGILPLFLCGSRWMGRSLVALPFVGTQPSICAEDPKVQQLLAQAAANLAVALGAGHVELRELEEKPWDWQVRQSYVNIQLPLSSDPDDVWRARLESRVRTKVRSARKQGLRVEWGGSDFVGDFFDMYAETMHRLGSPAHKKALFQNVLRAFPDEAEIALVIDGQRPVAGALVIHDQRWFGFPWAASRSGALSKYPNNLLYWELIKKACETGYEALDLGRSPVDSGTMHFKLQWGGIARPLWYHFALARSKHLPRRDASDPLMQYASQVWRCLPPGVATRLGPALARLIP